MPTFDEKIDDAEELLGQPGTADRRDHEAALGRRGAAPRRSLARLFERMKQSWRHAREHR